MNLQKILQLVPITKTSFVSKLPSAAPVAGRVTFGGTLLAQSLWAALKTHSGMVPVSLQTYFISGGDPNLCTEYSVTTLRKGGSHIHAQISATQKSKLVATSVVLLAKEASYDKTHSLAKTILPDKSQFQKAHQLVPLHPDISGIVASKLVTNFKSGPLDYQFPPSMFTGVHPKGISPKELQYYVKVRDSSEEDETAFKYVALTYFSDSYCLLTLPWFKNRLLYSHKFSTSLDHTIHYYAVPKINEDILLKIRLIESDAQNRHMLRADYFDSNGEQIASISQQGLVVFPEIKDSKL
ncbi:hypothetical protein TBLA_0H02360 [Henningerozyma blattae CBS 6284]|uniref:Acyl-CoA thioesterase II n=1 Tax=Henningerozyma blattae (strain ATCC 34711 / CBS 6284 / DSM 70876 / NBRC 10599 / NRRL Y-10934 / UCD 77-7) TaxID=1071380 RepID=I2H819_HENB6|nr:hypothetical protein TBLA_0H02360 [Tetrapisispora blattae CBS 6284]CCH62521.1 hypothetical protein TBLA_0H02360 [Tetrapisispora blattae CBS 6284]